MVFSFKLSLPPHAGRSSAGVHAVYTVRTNFILWLPSSAALRIARSRKQQSSVARLRSIHKYCLFPANTPIIFVVELGQHIRPVSAARLRWRCHARPDFQDRVPVHTNTTVNHRVLSHSRKMIHLLWLRSLLPLCPIFKRSLFFLLSLSVIANSGVLTGFIYCPYGDPDQEILRKARLQPRGFATTWRP